MKFMKAFEAENSFKFAKNFFPSFMQLIKAVQWL